MKRIIALSLAGLMLAACSHDLVVDNQRYTPYGVFTQDEADPSVNYKVTWGNVALGVLFFHTLIAPIYFFGFDMWEPVSKK